MTQEKPEGHGAKVALSEIRYSLRELLEGVQAEREGSTIGQEIVDQSEITKLFKRKKKVRGGNSGQ